MSTDTPKKGDYDGDGIVSEKERKLLLKKIERQGLMAWIAFITLIGSAIFLVFYAPESRIDKISEFDLLWLTLGSIVGFYFGLTGYMSKK